MVRYIAEAKHCKARDRVGGYVVVGQLNCIYLDTRYRYKRIRGSQVEKKRKKEKKAPRERIVHLTGTGATRALTLFQ